MILPSIAQPPPAGPDEFVNDGPQIDGAIPSSETSRYSLYWIYLNMRELYELIGL